MFPVQLGRFAHSVYDPDKTESAYKTWKNWISIFLITNFGLKSFHGFREKKK